MIKKFNENYIYQPKKKLNISEIVDGISNANPGILSQAITLLESKRKEDKALVYASLSKLPPSDHKSFRIGITGSPGVGKSTFIETFGKYLSSMGISVAVLTIDPSSKINGGSILGDKTRMEELSKDSNVFIRPSPSKGELGGVGEESYESILLCEKAGFDVILIETVGVGQSETHVKHVVDFFLLLILAGAGDELQGIKRGIMELADGIAITKSDGENEKIANIAKNIYQNAIHLLPSKNNHWITEVKTCSSIENKGIAEIWKLLEKFQKHCSENNWINNNRSKQDIFWFHQKLNQFVIEDFLSKENVKEKVKKMEESVKKRNLDPFTAATKIFNNES
jgi:LAO/AO transport system kinase